ncbi:hypothetical protein NFI96_005356 [Prochilodus magdalenae]|nr:hypothetical protein NFI96_005356 [Prochilodus magdalenae]
MDTRLPVTTPVITPGFLGASFCPHCDKRPALSPECAGAARGTQIGNGFFGSECVLAFKRFGVDSDRMVPIGAVGVRSLAQRTDDSMGDEDAPVSIQERSGDIWERGMAEDNWVEQKQRSTAGTLTWWCVSVGGAGVSGSDTAVLLDTSVSLLGSVLWGSVLWAASCGAASCGQCPVGQCPVGQRPVGQRPVGSVLRPLMKD